MNFLDTSNLGENFYQIGLAEDSSASGKKLFTIVNDATLYFLIKRPVAERSSTGILRKTHEPGFQLSQYELPLAALPWVIDTIENKFWKKASEGGLAGDVLHVDKIIEDEDLRIRFSPNCGAEDVSGFTFENYSRKEGFQNWQDLQVPYTLLREGGLLEQWKKIAKEYCE